MAKHLALQKFMFFFKKGKEGGCLFIQGGLGVKHKIISFTFLCIEPNKITLYTFNFIKHKLQ